MEKDYVKINKYPNRRFIYPGTDYRHFCNGELHGCCNGKLHGCKHDATERIYLEFKEPPHKKLK